MPDQSTIRNHLLRSMSREDFGRLAPHLEERRFERGEKLFVAGDAPQYAWFLDTALGSLVATSPEGHRIEGGIYGVDGFAPVGLILAAPVSPYENTIQLPGSGWRVPASVLVDAADASVTLRNVLLRFAHTLSVQTMFTALSNSVHPVDERLARWLLMCHDRTIGTEMELTHEFLSIMLAVRRPSVTTALHTLEGNRFIRAERRCITILDRTGLEEFAGDAYGKPEEEYRRLLGWFA